MSVVTNCILHFSISECEGDDNEAKCLADINTFFKDVKGFVSIDDPRLPHGWYGGTKMSEAPLFYGAFNHLDLDALCNHIKTIQFEDPESVQLIVQLQDEESFFIIEPCC